MKKILSTVLVFAILALSVFALVSCSTGPSGTYELSESREEEIMGFTIKFEAKSQVIFNGNKITTKVTMDSNIDELDLGVLSGTITSMVEAMSEGLEMTGTYEITEKDGKQSISVTYTDEDSGESDTETVPFEMGKDDKGDYVSIAGIKYYRP